MKKRMICLILCFAMVFGLALPAGATATAEAEGTLMPSDLTFRKVWSHRNMFNTQLDISTEDLTTQALGEGFAQADGALVLDNQSSENLEKKIPIGDHTPYGTYDLEVTEQSYGSDVRL